jgi:NADH-quinone oxidoreductase subunit L
MLLALIGTPAWPWFEEWLLGESAHFNAAALVTPEALKLIGLSLALVTVGVTASWLVYRNPSGDSRAPDPLEGKLGWVWKFLGEGMRFDATYDRFIIAPLAVLARGVDGIERHFFVPLMALAEGVIKMFGRWTGSADEKGLNDGFNQACSSLQGSADSASACQSGRPQAYLRAIGLGTSVLLILYFWLTA